MLNTPQPVKVYVEESPSIPFRLSVCEGLSFTGTLSGATYVHTIKGKDFELLLTGEVTLDAEPQEGALASGVIKYTAAQLATIGAGDYLHVMKANLTTGPVVVIKPSPFIIEKC